MVALSCSSLARMAPSIMRVMSFIFSCDRSVDLENCSATDAMELARDENFIFNTDVRIMRRNKHQKSRKVAKILHTVVKNGKKI